MPSSDDPKITETVSKKPDIPKGVKAGDFIVGKFVKSEWTRILRWEDGDHAARNEKKYSD